MTASASEASKRAPVFGYTLHGSRYLNLTSRCTLRCRFCPKFNGNWHVQGYDLRLRREPCVEEIVRAAGDPRAFTEVVFCGLGEPTLRLHECLAVARRLRRQGGRIRLNTDGLANAVYGRDVTAELGECIDAVSISLNAHNEETYRRVCRPRMPASYAALLDFIQGIRQAVPEVTVTAIDGLPGIDIDACATIARRLGVAFRRRPLDVVG